MSRYDFRSYSDRRLIGALANLLGTALPNCGGGSPTFYAEAWNLYFEAVRRYDVDLAKTCKVPNND